MSRGGVTDGLADRLGDAEFGGARASAVGDAGLGLADDAVHHGHALDGILSAGGFGGEHDGVGAVKNGVGHVGGFGAGGAGIFRHGFEHLGGGDDRDAEFERAEND